MKNLIFRSRVSTVSVAFYQFQLTACRTVYIKYLRHIICTIIVFHLIYSTLIFVFINKLLEEILLNLRTVNNNYFVN